MATLGQFDAGLRPEGWFDETAVNEGWFDADLIGSAAAGGAANITGAGQIASAEAFGQPAVAATISAAGIASAEAIGALDLQIVVDCAGIASGEAFGLPTISVPGGSWNVVDAGGIASEEAVGQPYITFDSPPAVEPGFGGRPWREPEAPHRVLGAGGISSAEAFGRPDVYLGARSRARRQRELRELGGHFLP